MKRVAAKLTRRLDTQKKREILFSRFPPGQIPEALDLLAGLEGVDARANLAKGAIAVGYDLTEYTLEGLETGLIDQGFHLDNTLMSKLMRTFIYYVEEIQLHNLGAPSRPLKSAPEGYVKAWEQHPHGDHDDTPPEWREYK